MCPDSLPQPGSPLEGNDTHTAPLVPSFGATEMPASFTSVFELSDSDDDDVAGSSSESEHTTVYCPARTRRSSCFPRARAGSAGRAAAAGRRVAAGVGR